MSKGPYKAASAFTGSKSLSRAHPQFKPNGSKMSSAHGTTGQSKSNNMNQGGSNTVGSCCRTFKSGYRQAGKS